MNITTWSLTLNNAESLQELTDFINEFEIKSGETWKFTCEQVTNATAGQNNMQHQWFRDAQQQGDQSAEEYRALCKLTIGVPILRRDSEEFRSQYDRTLKRIAYEDKLKLMSPPIDFPVTRLMGKKQKSEYLDGVHKFLSEQGFRLTEAL